jgi:Gas vesicle synthesis protein GvpL/GvpF
VSLLLHAITSPEAGITSPAGLRGHPLVCAQKEGLAAWATAFPDEPEQLTRADLLAHHELVSRLDEQLDGTLPARLPTWISDLDALERLLVARRDALSANLERVRGRTELAVTALWMAAEAETLSAEASTSGPGTRYLLQRRQVFAGSDRRRALAQQLADDLERLAASDLAEMQRQVCPSQGVALSAALLVARPRAIEVKARLRRVAHDVRILVNGPWPPYSFADVR